MEPTKESGYEPKKDEQGKEELGPLASTSEVFSYFGRTRKVVVLRVFGILFALISGSVYPIMAFYFAKSFENLGASVDGDFLSSITEVVMVFLVLGAVGFVFLVAQSTCLEIAASESTNDLKIQWFNALLRQDMAYYDIKDVSAQATIVSASAAKYKRGTGRKLAEGVQFTATVLGGFIYAFYASWRISLVILAAVPVMLAASIFMMSMTTKQTERKNKNYEETGGIVYNTIGAIRTVFSLNAADKMIVDFKAATQKAQDSAISFTYWIGFGNGAMMGSFIVSYVALTLYGSFLLYRQVRGEGCDPSNVVATNVTCDVVGTDVFGALMGVSFGAMGLAQIAGAAEAFTGARAACYPAILAINRKLGADYEENVPVEDPESADADVAQKKDIPLPKYLIDSSSDLGKKPNSVDGDLVFHDVSFAYPTRPDSLVFDNMSLRVKAGQTVALVGPSGGGKSTTVQLLERYYDPTSGSITLDGNDLKDLNVPWLRDQIGLVSQEPVLFARSIRENIAYGLPGATEEQIISVAKAANAHNFISGFPNGYDTQVGDKGAQLSGGQKQRIAIARILLKNPKILLLDEATSALDTESEFAVQQALDDVLVSGQRTTIVIAHRLSTIRNADVIAVVKGGKIVEQGSHDELMSTTGSEYAKLVEAQAPRSSVLNNSVSSSLKQSLLGGGYQEEVIESPQVQFKDVHFHYPTRPANQIFNGLNLSVKNGETLAIVGPSGGGKSTIIQMIERFYDPKSGSVEYEGTNIKDLNVQSLREQLGLVSQEPTLFNTTIRENIRYGKQGASQQEIEEAAKKANAHDFIMSFPQGYDTEVGENATQVSGGQKQRIAIARALIKNPKILLFDEATSALDSESEAVVQKAIDDLINSRKQTAIVIAHRLSTIKNADRIAVVADGVIKEIGTHDYLIAKPGGRYKRLIEYSEMGSQMKTSDKKKDSTDGKDETKEKFEDDIVDEEAELEKEVVKSISQRAKVLARNDWYLFLIGSIGAVLAGVVFPAWGIVFAYMIELLYYPVFPCSNDTLALIAEGQFATCEDYWNNEADYLKDFSFKVTYAWLGIIGSTVIGNMLLYYGFGSATERMNKRVRDAVFVSLMRQDIGFYDTQTVANLSTKLEDDAAMMHSFSGEPIRALTMTVASVLVGIFISFFYMW